MASAGRCAYFYRLARPLPLGAGDYVRSAGIGSACGEGVGVSLRFFYFVARRRVISSSSLLRRHRLFLLASLSRSRSVVVSSASCPVALSSCPLVVLIIAPCLMCFIPAPCVRSRLPCVLVLFLIASLPVFAISRAGRSLLAHFLFVAALALSSRVPVLACPSWIVFDRSLHSPFSSHAAACPASRLARVLSPSRSFVLPVLRQALAGSVSARSRCACPCPRRAGGWRCRLDGVGGAVLLLACSWDGGRAMRCCRLRVVFGLWCLCLYIQFGCLLVYHDWCRKKANEKGFSTMNEMVLNGASVAAGLVASPLMGIGLATGAVPVLTFGLYLAAMGWSAYRAVKCYENR